MVRVLLLVALAMPAYAQQEGLSVPYTMFSLPNGLTVILHEDHTTPTIGVNLWVRAGSARELPGRTGLAHLFEHLMFEGSAHVPEGKFDLLLEAAGGDNNASTTADRTNYWMDIPSNALELALFLESDRMLSLLDCMTPEKVDGQRDVVKNERRQNYENAPYGMAWPVLAEHLYPPAHPYHWPTIGSMEDLSAARYDDVVAFFDTYYRPNNASLCIAGDIDTAEAERLVRKWFTEIPAGTPIAPVTVPPVPDRGEQRLVMQDHVELPRLYMLWHSPPLFAPGDAELDLIAHILAEGDHARLVRRLVYDRQIAQDVTAFQYSQMLGSTFWIVATARLGVGLGELEREIQAELDALTAAPPTARELERARNQIDLSFLTRLERVGGMYGKADLLNAYYTWTGNPDYFEEDRARYRAVGCDDLRAIATSILRSAGRVVLSVVPQDSLGLASGSGQEVHPR